MKKLHLKLIALFVSISMIGFNQSTSISNVLNLKSAKQSGEIVENQKIVGYYVFYFKEKTDKKNSTYEISLFDDNFKLKKSFEIIRPKNTYLLETVFNGTCFLVYFYDSKTGLELTTFDKTGNKLGSALISSDDISSYERQRISTNFSSNSENISVYPLGKTGFVRQTFTKNKKLGYELVAYDNNMKKLWDISSPEESKLLETAEITDVSENFITATVTRRKNAMTKEMEMACLFINVQSGKLINELPLGSEEKGKLSLLKSTYNPEFNNFITIGEFYKPGDDILKDKSQGIYIRTISDSGKEVKMKQFKWKGDIDKFKLENIDEEDRKDADKPFSIFFHDVILAENGHIFLIGEQYKKQVSATAVAGKIAMAALGGGQSNVSNFEIQVANMVIIELDAQTDLVDFDLIKKKKSIVLLPNGASFWSTAFLGYYINSIGGFDYSFTSRDKEKDQYTIVYYDFNRKEENSKNKADCMLGVITINKGKSTEKRVPINTEAKSWWLNPAKPGYIAIGEYYKKEKKLSYRLESLNF